MQDELLPVSGGSNKRFGGWGATLVDNLDTLWIMGLKNEFKEALEAMATIEFGNPDRSSLDTVNLFETTIRFLGGLLATYDLTGCAVVLDKAVELGNMLYHTFDTATHVPIPSWNPRKALEGIPQYQGDVISVAAIGSLSMEFTRLAQITGDMRYFDAVERVSDVFQKQQDKTKLPGMWPRNYNTSTVDFTEDNTFSLGGNSDSAYEYLIKTHLLLGRVGSSAKRYLDMYLSSMETASRHLFFRPRTPSNSDILVSGWITVEDNKKPVLTPRNEHLTCFVGGMLALGGQALGNASHTELGRKLTDGCVWAYLSSPFGIAPENFEVIPCESPSNCLWDEALWEKLQVKDLPKGFSRSDDRSYSLRPEAIESVFYMYRITGDRKYQDQGWQMFHAMERETHTGFGNARIADVFRSPAPKDDNMESFWQAETLKYLYLLFSDPDIISLDEFVFNTEAHPFKLLRP
jgi:mannosyl-oligosaccharide alpha-1,2-mannosidase